MEDCPIELLGLEIGKGWFPLVKPIIDRVQDLNENGSDVKILQIKEKWGALRIYLLSAPEELLKQAHDAEEKSTRICEECGGPATQTEVNGWIYTRCSDCLEKLRRHNLSNQRLLWKCSCLTCARFTNYHSDLLCGDINTSIPKEVDILKGCDKWIEGNTNWYLIPSEDGFIKKVLTKEEENEIYNEFVYGNNPCDRMSEERLELAQHIKWRRVCQLKALNEKTKFKRDYMSKQITKKELFAALEGYPDDARIFFNDDDNHCVIHINRIDYEDDDLMPVLCPDPGGPIIFIHFQKKCGNVE